MLSKRSLRILVVADLLLVALGVMVGLTTEASLPEPLRAYEQARSEADMTGQDWVLLSVGIPLVIAVLVASIGLLAFWRPARLLYLVTIIAAIIWTPFAGPYITAGWAQAIDEASFILSGAIVALVYWSPLRELYERPKVAS